MQIRADQMQVFERDLEDQFTDQIIGHLRLHQRQYLTGIPEPELAARVESFKAIARSYGLTWQSSITGFVSLCFAVGPNFYRQPRIHAVLTDTSIEANERVQQLRHRIRDSDWGEASVVT